MLKRFVRVAFGILAVIGLCAPASASHLVTGNGFGFAVVAPEKGAATGFYSHPHTYVRPDPSNPLSEGVETTNFIKTLGLSAPAQAGSTLYVEDSHVVRYGQVGRGGLFFMPFGLPRPALVIVSERSRWRVEWNYRIKSQTVVGTATLLRFEGVDEALLVIPVGKSQTPLPAQLLSSSSAWVFVALEKESDVSSAIDDVIRWRQGLSPSNLVERELREFEHWRVKPNLSFKSEKERHLWRQSETMLRIAQSREPNRANRFGNGLIVAALPDVYSTPWVRDMAWATAALIRMGHRDEARAALLAYFNARPTGKMRAEVNGADYQISVVRYFGNGEEEPFFTQEGSTNIEFDNWGEVLWVLGAYFNKYEDPALLKAATIRGPVYESARDFVVKPLMANTERYGDGLIVAADTSIWEERQKDKKHFAFSTAMAIVGLREFAKVARKAGDKAGSSQALQNASRLQAGFDAAFIRGGRLRGTLEDGIKNDIDGALLPIINFGIVRNPEVVRETVKRMELLRVASGGYRRVRSTYTDPKIFEYWYERQEFLFVDFSLAELQQRLGRNAEGDATLKRIVDKSAADNNTIPEMYVAVPCDLFPGKVGDPTGAIPMVGYGPGAFVLNLLERESTSKALR